MKDPERLVLDDASSLERQLLQAGAAERVPTDVSVRMAARLGLPFAPEASLPPPVPPTLAVTTGGSASSLGPLLLTFGVGTLVVGGVVGGTWLRSSNGVGVRRRSAGDIAAEVRLLDSARAAIATGDRRGAARLLTRYDAEFPRGELRREARVLRGATSADTATAPAGPRR